jgi:hypothetical protein
MSVDRLTVARMLIAANILAMGAWISPARVYAAENDRGESQGVKPDGRGNRLRGQPPRGGPEGFATTGSVVTGNGINWYGGPVMHTINLYFLWYGNWSQDPNAAAILNNWAANIGGSSYFNINSTYGDNTGSVPNSVTFQGSYTDTGSLGTVLSDGTVAQIVIDGINSGRLGAAGQPDPNGVYMVLTAPGVQENSGFLTRYCGWHSYGTLSSTAVKYAFIGDPAGPSIANCAQQTSSSPNNDPGADAMVSVMSHELAETVTDPQVDAWYTAAGAENGDLCSWNFGTTYTAPNGSLANITLGGMHYLSQQIWLNAQGGMCALSQATAPDFGVSISNSPQTILQGTTSASYTLTATPSNGFNGAVTWTFSNVPVGISVNAAPNLSGSPATFTVSAAPGQPAGNYSVTVTGASGTLSHSLTANLTVTAPDFNVQVSGAQTVLPGGTSLTYTATATPMNGFANASHVTWSFTPPSGITVTPTSPTTGSSATFTLSASPSMGPGTQSIAVLGSYGSLSHSVNANLVVGSPAFSLTILPAQQAVARPSSGTATANFTVTVNSIGGFSGPVALSASGGTTGITPGVTPQVNAGSSGTLSVTVTSSAKRNRTRTLTVTGTSGTTSAQATATITIQ